MTPPLELVVARYHEDLAWLRRVPRNFVVTIYDKSPAVGPASLALPNVGREAHTYLHHLAERHESLAELTVFVQGHPFDHAPDLHKVLRALAEGSLTVPDFHWLGFLADTDDSRGLRLFVPWSKNPSREELDMDGFSRKVFGEPSTETYTFFVGGQFVVSRQRAQLRSWSFYAHAADVARDFPHAPHCFERCWDRVFGVNGTMNRLPAGAQTAYFKPIRRLTETPEHPDQHSL